MSDVYFPPGPSVLTLAAVAAGAPVDRPVYVVGRDTRQWDTFTSPAGPHRGHTLLIRKLAGSDAGGAIVWRGVMQCLRCPGRPRWSFTEYHDPQHDPRRPHVLAPGWSDEQREAAL